MTVQQGNEQLKSRKKNKIVASNRSTYESQKVDCDSTRHGLQ